MTNFNVDELTPEQVSFQLILHSGNARSKVIQSLRTYREGNVEKAAGGKSEFSLLLMHSEDHLMSTLTVKELVTKLIALFKEKQL